MTDSTQSNRKNEPLNDFREAMDAINRAITHQECDGIDIHAMVLWHYCRRLLSQVRDLNGKLEIPEDLCPVCLGWTWGRPGGSYNHRRCNECGEVRPEPKGDRA